MINVHVQVLLQIDAELWVRRNTTLLKDKEHPSEEGDRAESPGRQQH